MFGLPALGGKCGASNFNVDPSVTQAIAKNPRAVLVTLENETFMAPTVLEPAASMDDDFKALQTALTESCIVLFRDNTQWNLLSWIPAGTGVKKRTMYASSHGQLKGLLPSKDCREYAMVEPEDVSFESYKSHVGGASQVERLAAMTTAERERLEIDEAIAAEQRSQPQRLAGLAAVKATIAPSWEKEVVSVSKGGYSILFYKNNEIDGSFQSGLEKLSDLKGKLEAIPSYIVWAVDDTKVLVILWSPDTSSKEVRVLRMTLTSYKSNVVQQIKDLLPSKQIATGEVHDDDDLETFDAAKAFDIVAHQGTTAPEAPKWKPPAGAVAMPGLAGAVKMPGM
eukprot:GEMP01019069.1.p1 GENE.GEMP01019069.1~~GEMP01019069.1.p1  ORF type:complete len:339 (+),score=72.70 GEMP01019069.1:83-1099(+)